MDPQANPRRTSWLLLAGAAVALVAAGCIPAPGADNAFYILVPYAASIVATGLAFAAQARTSLRRPKPEAPETDWNAQLATRALAAAIAAAATIAGELVYLLLNGAVAPFGYASGSAPRAGGPLWAAAYIALLLAAGVCLFVLHKLAKQDRSSN